MTVQTILMGRYKREPFLAVVATLATLLTAPRPVYCQPQRSLMLFRPEIHGSKVTINGVDARRPQIPFAFSWGDGTATKSFFPATHTYSNTDRNYTVRVVTQYGDQATVEVTFVRMRMPPRGDTVKPEPRSDTGTTGEKRSQWAHRAGGNKEHVFHVKPGAYRLRVEGEPGSRLGVRILYPPVSAMYTPGQATNTRADKYYVYSETRDFAERFTFSFTLSRHPDKWGFWRSPQIRIVIVVTDQSSYQKGYNLRLDCVKEYKENVSRL